MPKQTRLGLEAAHLGRAKQTLAKIGPQAGDAQSDLCFFAGAVGADGKRHLTCLQCLQQRGRTRDFVQAFAKACGHVQAQLLKKSHFIERLVLRRVAVDDTQPGR